jgi:hypothetical protein
MALLDIDNSNDLDTLAAFVYTLIRAGDFETAKGLINDALFEVHEESYERGCQAMECHEPHCYGNCGDSWF